MLRHGGPAPLRELMFGVPAQVVAVLCGLDDADADEASRLIADFVQCIPASATPPQQAAAARAAAALRDLLGPALDARGDGLLAELVRRGRPGHRRRRPAGQRHRAAVADVRRHRRADRQHPGGARELPSRAPAGHGLRWGGGPRGRPVRPPIQNTRRFAAAPTRIGDARLAAGDPVLVLLAAANRDPAGNVEPPAFRTERKPTVFTFGAAAHRCPGETVAVAIAAAVVAELLGAGFDPAGVATPAGYLPLANARIPQL